jgi:hypothetical protein
MNILTGWILWAVAVATAALVWSENSIAQMPPMYAAIVPPHQEAAKRPLTCLHDPYFNVCGGMARKYQTRQILNAGWDGHQLVNETLGPVTGTVEENTAVVYCSSFPGKEYFAEEEASGANPTSLAYSLDHSVWTTKDGRQYIGEAYGRAGKLVQVLSTGEPMLTLNPVAGEVIETEYNRATSCGGPMTPLVSQGIRFSTYYQTVEHLGSYTDAAGQVWTDVWHTSLIEWTNAPPEDWRFYDYFFARGPGLVEYECYAQQNLCGTKYTLIAEVR